MRTTVSTHPLCGALGYLVTCGTLKGNKITQQEANSKACSSQEVTPDPPLFAEQLGRGAADSLLTGSVAHVLIT